MARAGYAGRLLFLFMALLTAILAGCGGKGGSEGSSGQANTSATVERLEVNPVDSQAAKGTTVPFKAVAILSNGTSRDVTQEVAWSSSDTAVATMDAATRGLARAVAEGTADITASHEGKSASGKLTVTSAVVTGFQITPVNPSLPKGTQLQLQLTTTLSDGTTQDLTAQAEWSSSQAAIAFVSNAPDSKGELDGLAKGTAVITATAMGRSATANVTVRDAAPTAIKITPVAPELAVGGELRFVAMATYSDGSRVDVTYSQHVEWSSSDTSVATVSNVNGASVQSSDKGRAVALKEGSTTISVRVPGLTLTDSTVLSVVPLALTAIEVTPLDPSAGKGSTLMFKAYAKYNDGSRVDVTEHSGTVWSSSDADVAPVSNVEGKRGEVKALEKGEAEIQAVHAGMTGSSQLTVTDATVKSIRVTGEAHVILLQMSAQFTATATYTDGSVLDVTEQATWLSTSTSVAQISNAAGSKGLATGVGDGITYLQAKLDGVSNYDSLEVKDATIERLEIEPSTISLPKLTSGTPRARAYLSDDTQLTLNHAVTWSSANPEIATVSDDAGSKGLITGVEMGSTTVTAIEPLSGKQGSATVTITQPKVSYVVISPANAVLPAGVDQQYTVVVHYVDGSKFDFTNESTWTSADENIAAFQSPKPGLLTPLTGGETTICADTYGSINCTTVTVLGLDSIDVTPKNATLRNSGSQQYAAVGTYSDGSQRTLTSQVTWSSSHTQWVTISNTDGSRGLARAVGGTPVLPVTVTIGASLSGVTGSTTVTRTF